jgi:hypothetical protein
MAVSCQRHAPAALNFQEMTSSTNWIGGWVGFRAGLNTEARGKGLCLCRESNTRRQVRSQDIILTELPQLVSEFQV